jgi:hypothetical protein
MVTGAAACSIVDAIAPVSFGQRRKRFRPAGVGDPDLVSERREPPSKDAADST